MKRTIVIVMVLLAMASSGTYAAGKAMGFSFDNLQTSMAAGSTTLGLESIQSWLVEYTGSASVSATDTTATLTGNFGGNIWQYSYSSDGTTWITFDRLVSSIFMPAYTIGGSGTVHGPNVVITARYFRLAYDVTLATYTNAAVSGTASITATAVPEPGSLVALCGGLFGLAGFAVRRRKAEVVFHHNNI